MGDSESEQFKLFVAGRGDQMFRVALALTGGHHAAEDLLQDALARTYARWRHVRGDPEAYVRRAMYHSQITAWRRRGRLREVPASHVPDRADPRDEADASERRLQLRQALMRLGPRQRAVLVARFFEDLSDVEAAQVLGCSPSTVRSQTHRALARLREIAPELAGLHTFRESVR
ncbi:SigE family RNA polymerase sigma factor [Phytohabitans sp. ZYX-F-186]|uniref:SigE family RNA polymerase sigma factor n=1 Tax=Phytohabitans maris TaxID=3071409 RepID=A0ABU0ZGQ8_9ACTN|nr:SigE family RNA polymerase sigma factor [Phytohabitans sp. ZYX-F-186]MDQ7906236.1 SigE family RNA polymerase sigma factor [Phytohabitans sp. ZYX-F-186]